MLHEIFPQGYFHVKRFWWWFPHNVVGICSHLCVDSSFLSNKSSEDKHAPFKGAPFTLRMFRACGWWALPDHLTPPFHTSLTLRSLLIQHKVIEADSHQGQRKSARSKSAHLSPVETSIRTKWNMPYHVFHVAICIWIHIKTLKSFQSVSVSTKYFIPETFWSVRISDWRVTSNHKAAYHCQQYHYQFSSPDVFLDL